MIGPCESGKASAAAAAAAESAYFGTDDDAVAVGGRKKPACMICDGACQGYMCLSQLSFHPSPPSASLLLSSELHLRLH